MSTDYAKIFGRNIQHEMDKQNIELYELANHMDFNMTETMQLLDGRLMLSIPEMNKIANFLGVDIKELGKNKIR